MVLFPDLAALALPARLSQRRSHLQWERVREPPLGFLVPDWAEWPGPLLAARPDGGEAQLLCRDRGWRPSQPWQQDSVRFNQRPPMGRAFLELAGAEGHLPPWPCWQSSGPCLFQALGQSCLSTTSTVVLERGCVGRGLRAQPCFLVWKLGGGDTSQRLVVPGVTCSV